MRIDAVSLETVEGSHEGSSNGSSPPKELSQLDLQKTYSPGTLAVHGGERAGRPRVSDSLTTPIVQTSTYTFENTQQLIDYQEGKFGSYEYGRYGNPTSRACEEKIRAMEGAEDALVSASGMNCATTMLLALVPAGGHIVTTTDCYRRTRQFIQVNRVHVPAVEIAGNLHEDTFMTSTTFICCRPSYRRWASLQP